MKVRRFSHIQIIALGFFVMIIAGTMLLMLPVSSRSGEWTPFLTSMFTATSASCVTGLILVDTATYWSVFGQIIIICLIQIGGLGFMTIATVFFSLMRKNIGLRGRAVTAESINTTHIGGIRKITKKIVIGTAFFEIAGAIALSFRFVKEYGFFKGVYFGVFHSVSAFCNAGFDIMGFKEQYCSLTPYSDDVLVNVTVMLLITVGGIGFLVWDDIAENKFRFKRYQLHTKIVLTTSAILTFGGALLIYLLEKDNLFAGLGTKETVLDSLFSSVTARTAGFNTTDTGALTQAGKVVTMILMLIGGSSGSTAGGVKTTTIAIIVLYLVSGFRSQQSPHIFGRRVEENSMRKASTILFFNFALALTAGIIICAVQKIDITDVMFETLSAIGTVGMTTGITRELSTASRVIVAFLMYCGRVGSVSFALALLEKRATAPVTYPVEKITIG